MLQKQFMLGDIFTLKKQETKLHKQKQHVHTLPSIQEQLLENLRGILRLVSQKRNNIPEYTNH